MLRPNGRSPSPSSFGLAVAAVYVGLSVGPFAGGLLTEGLGWRGVFLVPALGTLPALALVIGGVYGYADSADGTVRKLSLGLAGIGGIGFVLVLLGVIR